MNRRQFLQLGPVALAALTTPLAAGRSLAQTRTEPPEIGRSTRRASQSAPATIDLGKRQSLRLLQFTDNHFFCGVKEGLTLTEAYRKTERDWRELVRIFSPDLIVFTGDSWHDNPGGRGMKSLLHVLRRVEPLGVPWAFCWGNHDLMDDYQAGHDVLENARHSLYRGGATHGDYRIEVRTASTKGTAAAHLWFLSSNRHGLTAWQLDWLRADRAALAKTGVSAVPSLAFYHIPLLEQKTLFESGQTPGILQEEVCHEMEAGVAASVFAPTQSCWPASVAMTT